MAPTYLMQFAKVQELLMDLSFFANGLRCFIPLRNLFVGCPVFMVV